MCVLNDRHKVFFCAESIVDNTPHRHSLKQSIDSNIASFDSHLNTKFFCFTYALCKLRRTLHELNAYQRAPCISTLFLHFKIFFFLLYWIVNKNYIFCYHQFRSYQLKFCVSVEKKMRIVTWSKIKVDNLRQFWQFFFSSYHFLCRDIIGTSSS